MPFSAYLNQQRENCAALVEALGKHFQYVSILGTDVHATMIRADRRSSAVQDGAGECGFVVKMHDGKAFYEYSLDDISGDKAALAEKILAAVQADPALEGRMISAAAVADEPMVKDFVRESDFDQYTDEQLLGICQELGKELQAKDEKILNDVYGIFKEKYKDEFNFVD